MPGVRGNFDFFEIVVTGFRGLTEAGVNHRADVKLQAWIGSKKSNPLSIAYLQRITGALSRGFGNMSKRGGTNRWIGIHLKAGWTFCLRKPKANTPRISIGSPSRQSDKNKAPDLAGMDWIQVAAADVTLVASGWCDQHHPSPRFKKAEGKLAKSETDFPVRDASKWALSPSG